MILDVPIDSVPALAARCFREIGTSRTRRDATHKGTVVHRSGKMLADGAFMMASSSSSEYCMRGMVQLFTISSAPRTGDRDENSAPRAWERSIERAFSRSDEIGQILMNRGTHFHAKGT